MIMNKQNICNFFLTFIILCTVTTTADADIIRGRVVDSETKEPLPDASVTLTQKYDFASSTSWGKADSLGVFYMYADGKCTIEASMLGYYSKSKTVLVLSDSRKDTLDIGDIALKMSPRRSIKVLVSVMPKRTDFESHEVFLWQKLYQLHHYKEREWP